MNLREYYDRIREIEATIQDPYPLIVGKNPVNGSYTNVVTEVSRALAAKMLTEGSAILATAEQGSAFRQAQADALREIREAAEAAKIQLSVLTTDELRKLKAAVQPDKE